MTVFIVSLIDLGEEHPAAVIVWGKSTECGVFFNVVQVAETRHLVLHLVPEACLVETPASGVQRARARVVLALKIATKLLGIVHNKISQT